MSQFVETPTRVFKAGAAIGKYLRVGFSSSKLAKAGAHELELGTLEDEAFADGDLRSVRLRTAQGTRKMVASGAISADVKVYGDAAGKVSATANGRFIGYALEATTADGDIFEVLPVESGDELLYDNVAASAAVTNTTTETDFDKSYSIPANTLKAGDVIRVTAQVIATATNSTDTLAIKLKLGSTVLATSGALDVANDDICVVAATIVIRTAGASGTLVACGFITIGVEGTSTVKAFKLASTAVDTTVAQVLKASATWSVANAGNSCRLDVLAIERLAR